MNVRYQILKYKNLLVIFFAWRQCQLQSFTEFSDVQKSGKMGINHLKLPPIYSTDP